MTPRRWTCFIINGNFSAKDSTRMASSKPDATTSSTPGAPRKRSAKRLILLFLGAVIALMDLALQFLLVRLPQLLLGR